MISLPDSIRKRLGQGTRMVDRAASFGQNVMKVGTGAVRDRFEESRLTDDFAPGRGDRFVAAAYFPSRVDSVYQMTQWLWPFEQLAVRLREQGHGDRPFGIIARDVRAAKTLRSQTTLPVRFSRLSKGLDSFMQADDLRVVFYVNQAKGNFQGLRFPRPAHVHLSHGESEKISMISNQLKAYDHVFTAGHAARQRISRHLIGMNVDAMRDVGRPQLDRPRERPDSWQEFDARAPEGSTVFYAPTWEGDSAAMAYGTLVHNGPAVVRTLLGAGHRVIFRPHPRTGVLNREFAKALEEVRGAIVEHPRGFMDSTPDVSWQFDVAEVALAEMSSVAFDWLSTRKPLVMVAPHDPGAEVLPGGLFDRCPTLMPGEERSVATMIDRACRDRERFVGLSEEYLGDTAPGEQLERFLAAASSVIAQRELDLGRTPGL